MGEKTVDQINRRVANKVMDFVNRRTAGATVVRKGDVGRHAHEWAIKWGHFAWNPKLQWMPGHI